MESIAGKRVVAEEHEQQWCIALAHTYARRSGGVRRKSERVEPYADFGPASRDQLAGFARSTGSYAGHAPWF